METFEEIIDSYYEILNAPHVKEVLNEYEKEKIQNLFNTYLIILASIDDEDETEYYD